MQNTRFQKWIASILLCSFAITGCGSFHNSSMKIQQKRNRQNDCNNLNHTINKFHKKYKQRKNINTRNEIISKNTKFINKVPIYTSNKKYKVQFLKKSNTESKQKALISWNLAEGLTKTEIWDVIIQDEDHTIDKFLKFDKEIQSLRLHASFDSKSKKGIITIGKKGKGGMWDMNEDVFRKIGARKMNHKIRYEDEYGKLITYVDRYEKNGKYFFEYKGKYNYMEKQSDGNFIFRRVSGKEIIKLVYSSNYIENYEENKRNKEIEKRRLERQRKEYEEKNRKENEERERREREQRQRREREQRQRREREQRQREQRQREQRQREQRQREQRQRREREQRQRREREQRQRRQREQRERERQIREIKRIITGKIIPFAIEGTCFIITDILFPLLKLGCECASFITAEFFAPPVVSICENIVDFEYKYNFYYYKNYLRLRRYGSNQDINSDLMMNYVDSLDNRNDIDYFLVKFNNFSDLYKFYKNLSKENQEILANFLLDKYFSKKRKIKLLRKYGQLSTFYNKFMFETDYSELYKYDSITRALEYPYIYSNNKIKTSIRSEYNPKNIIDTLKLIDRGVFFEYKKFRKKKSFFTTVYEDGNNEIFERILNLNYNPDEIRLFKNKIPILNQACIDNKKELVKNLMIAGANANPYLQETNAIFLATKYGNCDIIDIIAENSKYKIFSDENKTNKLLKKAYKKDHLDVIDQLINLYKLSPNGEIFNNKYNLLQKASEDNKIEVVELLFKSNRYIDQKLPSLNIAISKKNNKIVKCIYDNFIVPSIIEPEYRFFNFNFSKEEKRPENVNKEFKLSISCDNFEAADIIKRYINIKLFKEQDIKDILIKLYRNKQFKLIEYILEKGIHPDIYKDENNKTLFSLSISDKNLKFSNLLLKYGADIDNYRDESNRTLLKIAYDDKDISKIIEYFSKGAKVESYKDQYGNTIIHDACFSNRQEELLLFLDNCSRDDILKPNNYTHTPLDFAKENNNLEIVQIIKNKLFKTSNLFSFFSINFNGLFNFFKKREDLSKTTIEIQKQYLKSLIENLENDHKLTQTDILETFLKEQDLQKDSIKALRLLSTKINLKDELLDYLFKLFENEDLKYDIIAIFINQLNLNDKIEKSLKNKIIKLIEENIFKEKFYNLNESILKSFDKINSQGNELSKDFLNKYLKYIIDSKIVNNFWKKDITSPLANSNRLLPSTSNNEVHNNFWEKGITSPYANPNKNRFIQSLIDTSNKRNELHKIIDNKIENLDNKQKYEILRFISKNFNQDIIKEHKVEDWKIETEIEEASMNFYVYNSINLEAKDIDFIKDHLRENFSKKDILAIYKSFNKNDPKFLTKTKVKQIFKFLSIDTQEALKILIEHKENWYEELENFWSSKLMKGLSFIPPPSIYNFYSKKEKQIDENQIKELTSFFKKLNFSANLIESFISNIKTIKNYNDVYKIIELIVKHQDRFDEKMISNSIDKTKKEELDKAKKWISALEKELLKEKVNKLYNVNNKRIYNQLSEILDKGCSFKTIDQNLDYVLDHRLYYHKYYENALKIAYEYNLSKNNYEEYFKEVEYTEGKEWEEMTSNFAVSKTFAGSHELDIDELLNRIYKKSKDLDKTISKGDLKTKYFDYKKRYKNKSSEILFTRCSLILDFEKLKNKAIKNYNQSDVRIVAKLIKSSKKISDEEILAIICRAIAVYNIDEKSDWILPRKAQILSALIFINKNKRFGHLEQINTGEGKTLVAGIVAAHRILKKGKKGKVDIVTSSIELIKQNIDEMKGVYKMLDISYARNDVNEKYQDDEDKKLRKIYKKNIVYGTPLDFASHIIQDQIERKNIRSGRGFDYAILDEADNLLFDAYGTRALLCPKIPGMNHCLLPLASAFKQVECFKMRTIQKDNEYFYCKKDLLYKDGEFSADSRPFEDISEYLIKVNDPSEAIKEHIKLLIKSQFRTLDKTVEKDWEEKKNHEYKLHCLNENIEDIKKQIKTLEDKGKTTKKEKEILKEKNQKLNKLYAKTGNLNWFSRKNQEKKTPCIQTPKHLRDYIQYKIPIWIEKSFYLKDYYKNERDYIIKEGKTKHVDYNNTGVVSDMRFSDGVGQLISLINKTKLEQENPITRYLSYHSYFKKYKNLLGMTGTTGDETLHKFFDELFGLKIVIIPPFAERTIYNKKKNGYICKELKPIVLTDEEEWKEEICKTIAQKTKNNIPSLIICKEIKIANKIKEKLGKYEIGSSRVSPYTGVKEFNIKNLNKNDIIISTNISGRGTDLRTNKEIEKNAGLYVCVIFIPNNKRIEIQNVGRTARKGNRGTAQLIIYDPYGRDIKTMKEERDENEKRRIENSYEHIQNIVNKDKLFSKFCDLLNTNYENYQICHRRAIIERWGIWLKMNENLIVNDYKKALKEYENFEKEILEEKRGKHKSVIKNPYYYTLIGNNLLKSGERKIEKNKKAVFWKYKWKYKFEDAITSYNKAIKLDPIYSIEARYYKAYALIKLGYYHLNIPKKLLKEVIELTQKYQIDELQTLAGLITKKENHKAIKQIKNLICIHANKIQSAEKVIRDIKYVQNNSNHNIAVELIYLSRIFKDEFKDEIKFVKENNGLFALFGSDTSRKPCLIEWLITSLVNVTTFLFGLGMSLVPIPIISNIGIGLMCESVSNFICTSYDYFINGKLNIAEWAKSKVKSMIISASVASLCHFAGISNISSAGNAPASQGANEFTKQVLLASMKTALYYGAIGAIGHIASNKALEIYEASQSEERLKQKKEIENKICARLERNPIVKNAIEIDKNLKNNNWQTKLNNDAIEVIKNHNSGDWSGDAKAIGNAVCNNTAKERKLLFDAQINIIHSGCKTCQAETYLNKFLSDYENRIEKKYRRRIDEELSKSKKSKLIRKKIADKTNKINLTKGFIKKEILKGFKPAYIEEKEFCSRPLKANLKATTYIPSNVEYLSQQISENVSDVINNNKKASIGNFISQSASLVSNYTASSLINKDQDESKEQDEKLEESNSINAVNKFEEKYPSNINRTSLLDGGGTKQDMFYFGNNALLPKSNNENLIGNNFDYFKKPNTNKLLINNKEYNSLPISSKVGNTSLGYPLKENDIFNYKNPYNIFPDYCYEKYIKKSNFGRGLDCSLKFGDNLSFKNDNNLDEKGSDYGYLNNLKSINNKKTSPASKRKLVVKSKSNKFTGDPLNTHLYESEYVDEKESSNNDNGFNNRFPFFTSYNNNVLSNLDSLFGNERVKQYNQTDENNNFDDPLLNQLVNNGTFNEDLLKLKLLEKKYNELYTNEDLLSKKEQEKEKKLFEGKLNKYVDKIRKIDDKLSPYLDKGSTCLTVLNVARVLVAGSNPLLALGISHAVGCVVEKAIENLDVLKDNLCKFFKSIDSKLSDINQKYLCGLILKAIHVCASKGALKLSFGVVGNKNVKKLLAKLGKRYKAGNGIKNNVYLNKGKDQVLKSKRSYQKLLQEHQQKLRDYKLNPDKFDNKGILKNASNKQIREKIIEGRIKELSSQIHKHKTELIKIEEALKK